MLARLSTSPPLPSAFTEAVWVCCWWLAVWELQVRALGLMDTELADERGGGSREVALADIQLLAEVNGVQGGEHAAAAWAKVFHPLPPVVLGMNSPGCCWLRGVVD